LSDARTRVLADALEAEEAQTTIDQRAMLFTDFDGRRRAVRLELVQRIETVAAEAIDIAGDRVRVVIDGVILPVIGLTPGPLPAPRIRLLRLSDGACELLYAVREVNDAIILSGDLKPVHEDPMIEAITLVEQAPVSLIDGHEFFARLGEAPMPLARPKCRLPDTEWARTILAPLVTAAGYDVDQRGEAGSGHSGLTIWLDEEYEVAQALGNAPSGPVIRLRDHPDAAPGSETIYRYDREGLNTELRKQRSVVLANYSRDTTPDKGEAA